jgi:GH15 family glucan-1,4-alpha-glucosidase
MPRPLVIGNGRLLINFDEKLQMRDCYYPYVGQLNHVGGYRCKLGIWVDGHFAWLDEDTWERMLDYKQDTLVTNVSAYHRHLGIRLLIEDGVHQRETIYLKKVTIQSDVADTREVRLFLHHDFSLDGTEVGDTAVYDPDLHTVYHYKRNVYVLANGKAGQRGIDEYSIGIKRFNEAEGTWRDAEDGHLEGNPIAQGSVDSTISFRLTLDAGKEGTLYYWLCLGNSYEEVRSLNQYVLESGPDRLLDRIGVYWQRWVNKEERDFADLPEEIVKLYKKSLLIVRTQIDQNGGILAANDSDILQYNRDHYSYVWPRDGALIALAMNKAGHAGAVAPFYLFCRDALTNEGYLRHKYNPDGSVGSSWHPFIWNGEAQLPIQEDETALVLYALWEHYAHGRQIEFCQSLYASLIRPAAKFLLSYRDPNLRLPLPSYDLWEERRGIFTFTSSAVYAALQAAARFARVFGDDARHERYQEAAEELKQAMIEHLYDKETGRFLRGLYLGRDGSMVRDHTVESSLFALFSFGVLPADDPRVARTMEDVKNHLRVQTPVGGYARYQGDGYFRKSYDTKKIPGNPWIITTLWVAEWEIAKARTVADLAEPLEKIDWVRRHALESGVLPEQLDPFTGAPVSVAPLTWSHSTLILTVRKYVEKYRELQGAGGGGTA